MSKERCAICKKCFSYRDLYEYRGIIHCEKCHDVAIQQRDAERAEIIVENKYKTDRFKGLDLSNSQIGRANRDILKKDIEIAKKESIKIKNYEDR